MLIYCKIDMYEAPKSGISVFFVFYSGVNYSFSLYLCFKIIMSNYKNLFDMKKNGIMPASTPSWPESSASAANGMYMNMINISIRMTATLLLAACFSAGCSDRDTPESIDPAGTVELVMAVNGEPPNLETAINGAIYISHGVEFCGGAHPVKVTNIGRVNGLGDIVQIPASGWSMSVPVEPRCGYIAYYDGIYYRIYVVETVSDSHGQITEARVKYQMPFEPTSLTPSAKTLSFGVEGDYRSVDVSTDAAEWNFTCSEPWLEVSRYNNSLAVRAAENKTILRREGEIVIRANERTERIVVTQEPALRTSPPYATGDVYHENGVTGVVYKVSGDGMHGMMLSLHEAQRAWSVSTEYAGCYSESNGAENMDIIKQTADWQTSFPAFKWCDDLNTDGGGGWYLPAINEMLDLYLGFSGMSEYKPEDDAPVIRRAARDRFNETLILNGGAALREDGEADKTGWKIYPYYWSSSEAYAQANRDDDSFQYVGSMEFAFGRLQLDWANSKNAPFNVRAVRAF
jgi:hypothetical protein